MFESLQQMLDALYTYAEPQYVKTAVGAVGGMFATFFFNFLRRQIARFRSYSKRTQVLLAALSETGHPRIGVTLSENGVVLTTGDQKFSICTDRRGLISIGDGTVRASSVFNRRERKALLTATRRLQAAYRSCTEDDVRKAADQALGIA